MRFAPLKVRRELLLSSLVLLLFSSLCSFSLLQAQDTKRGIAGGTIDNANALNSRWMYTWGNNLPADINNFNGEFVPMIWTSTTANVQPKINNILSYASSMNVEYVLGFNEPERVSQANMSVAQAIDVWDIMTDGFAGSGLKLVSPAGSGNEGEVWLADFMAEVDTRNSDADPSNDLQVDEIAFHWYGTISPTNPVQSANNFLAKVDQHWNLYGRPVWITEFGGLDFGDDDVTSPDLIAANAAFLDVVIPGLESRSYVNRYSWWQFGQPDNGEEDDTKLIEEVNGVWTPTVIGDPYIPTYGAGETFDINGNDYGKDNIYLNGATITNTGGATTPAIGSIYAFQGNNVITGSSDWGAVAGDSYVATGATLQKTGSNTITLNGVDIQNDGTTQINNGTLRIEVATVSGSGSIELHPGAVISLGKSSDRSGVSITQGIELHGGAIQANTLTDGSHSISGTSTLHGTTTFSGNGSLPVNGSLVAPGGGGGGGIVKDGTGTLVLNSANTYEGDTTVQSGTLKLGASGTISNSPQIEVQSTGTLDVISKAGGFSLDNQTLLLKGQIAGSINATNGSVVSILDSSAVMTGDLTNSNSIVSIGGTGFNESGPLPTIVGTGLQLHYNASLDTAGDTTWTNQASAGNDLAFVGNESPSIVSDVMYPGITAAYDIGLSDSASGLIGYFEELTPQRSREDATFEVVFYVSDTSAGNEQVLFEVGAGRGVSFLLSDNSLSFNVDGDGSNFSLTSNLSVGWHHAVGVIDIVGTLDDLANDSIELFIDNVSAGSLDNLLIDDWAGGNTSGLGGDAAGTAGATSPMDYHGQIAIARYYQDYLFDSQDVAQNYSTLVGSGNGVPTSFTLDGNFMQLSNGILEIDLFDPSTHDLLDVTGNLDAAGTLKIALVAGAPVPQLGDVFNILSFGSASGAFDTYDLPALAAGLFWDTSNLLSTGEIAVVDALFAPEDLNQDGFVDSLDLGVLLGNWNQPTTPAMGELNGIPPIDGLDLGILLAAWNPPPLSSSAAVPEPSSITLAFMISLYLVDLARKRRVS